MKKVFIILTMIFVLAGCGSDKVDNTNEVVNDNTSANVSENKTSNNASDIVELYSDDTKIVFKQANNSSIVFYYEGNTITGYELYLNYEDPTTASVAYTVLQKDHSAYENVESISQKGQYVIIKYNNDAYSGYTLEEVKMTYAALEQVTKK